MKNKRNTNKISKSFFIIFQSPPKHKTNRVEWMPAPYESDVEISDYSWHQLKPPPPYPTIKKSNPKQNPKIKTPPFTQLIKLFTYLLTQTSFKKTKKKRKGSIQILLFLNFSEQQWPPLHASCTTMQHSPPHQGQLRPASRPR